MPALTHETAPVLGFVMSHVSFDSQPHWGDRPQRLIGAVVAQSGAQSCVPATVLGSGSPASGSVTGSPAPASLPGVGVVGDVFSGASVVVPLLLQATLAARTATASAAAALRRT